MADAQVEWIEQKLQEARQFWEECHTARRVYDDLVHRYVKPILDPRVGNQATGADYRTPDLADAEVQVQDILHQDPARFDAAPASNLETAQKEANQTAKWIAAMDKVLDGGWWTDKMSSGQARHGFKWSRLMVRERPEPEGDREKFMRGLPPRFYLEDVDNLSVYEITHGGKPEVRFWDYELPVLRAQDEYKLDGKLLGDKFEAGKTYVPVVDQIHQKKLGFVGEAEARDGGRNLTQVSEKLHVTICEYKDYTRLCPICTDQHPLWTGVEAIYADGMNLGDGVVVQTYNLLFKHEPTLRFTGSSEGLDIDPHFLHRPFLHSLFVEAATINWANTVLHYLANKDTSWENVYSNMAELPEWVVANIPEEAWSSLSLDLPDQEPGKVAFMPKLEVWPSSNLEPTFLELKRDAEARFKEKQPNRWLTGKAFEESTEGTGSAALGQMQQAGLPFNRLLTQQSNTRKRLFEDILHYIELADHLAPGNEEWKYFATATGSENLLRGATKPGEELYMSASRLSTHPDLIVVTKSETLQEQAERQRLALERWRNGIDDDEQLLEAMGHYDTDGQLERIAKQQARRAMHPDLLVLRKNLMRVLMPSIFRIDPSLMPPPEQPPTLAGTPQGGEELRGQQIPTINLPAEVGSVSGSAGT